ncbi:hypothetical protein BT63DRAFT_95276 [Microthyrium microscopicum]|uniref:WIBG Mago-binding domain-containing protein n=1 Tax=Microthyrium microscopicum TaxID=703497 RepID=A0A6A6U0M9_9PEZI|nr:hypothetical protein BT63DRAFT_95276 [Microthyrium microscopicum]
MAPSPPPLTEPTQSTKSGITTDENGIRHIPASVRPDGSLRKEIKIRPGYRPPEDVEVYRNRTAEAWSNRSKGGVIGAEAVDEENKGGATANKNAKRREARKKAAAAAKTGDGDSEGKGVKKGGDKVVEDEGKGEKQEEVKVDDKEKEAKKLAKKLRQARELKSKQESQGAPLLPEQINKVIQINELIKKLDALGFDANGDKKGGEGS